MTARCALLAALLGLGACRQTQTTLEVVFDEDGGACESHTDLSCVNYLQFQLTSGSEMLSNCITVEHKLKDLCGVRELATGVELFRRDPDDDVTVTLSGLRVFPATSCDLADCPARTIFKGSTAKVRLGDVAGGSVPLPISFRQDCGPKEQYFPRQPGQDCQDVCTFDKEPVCEPPGGCLCRPYYQPPPEDEDGGVRGPDDAAVPVGGPDADGPQPGGLDSGAPDGGALDGGLAD